MRKAKEKNKPLLSLAAAGLAALLLFGMATAVLAQGTQGKFVADEWSGIAEADIAEGDSTKDQAENQASTTPTPTPVSTQDESTALSDATPESAESSELTENKETDSDSNAEIPAEVSAFSNDLAVEEVSLYDASGTSAQDAVTSWTELKSAVASAANGATIYLSGEITIPLDEVLSVSKNLRLVGTGSAQYTNTVGVGSETVAQGYTYTQSASLRMGDASGVQTDHDNVMIYISGGTTLEIENVFLNGNNNCENVVYTEGTDSKISLQNCTVGYGNDNGILLNPGQAEINGSLVFNNGEYAGDGTALYRFENGSAVLSGNVRSQGLGGGGLTCAAGSHVQAAASSFVWNKTSGFDIPEADSSASAENCFFWGNGWTGANVRSNSVMTLTGCQVENNGYNTANLLTTDGDTASNTFPGLDVQGAGTMKISHCGILNNAGNGVQCYPDSKTYLYGWNHIYANGINGVYTQGQLWIGKAADSANGDETTAVYNNAADGVHTDGGTVQGDHLNCYGNSYSGISAMKNESLDQTATLELTAPVTSHENGHSGLYLKGGTKATVSGGSFTENGAEHAEIYAGSGTDTTLKDGVEVKTSADKTLQNSGLRIAVMLDAPTKTVTDEAGNDLNGGTVRAGDTLVYTVTCCNPADVAKTVTITDAIPEGTELVENSITENGAENNGKIVWTLEIPTQSEARVSFTVRVQSVVMGNSVSNRASVQYREDKITLPTDEVTTNVEPGKITVTKKLPASDLLAAHGAPVFTFTLTDAKGRVQRQSVQLSLDAEPDENGDVCASVTFTGLSGGVYTVIESQTACHALVQFEDAENGTAKADCAVLELTGCRASASVTARNVRQSWAEDRDCALIVNEITPKQDNS